MLQQALADPGANEALDTARRLGRPEELGIAVCAYLWSAEVTDHFRQTQLVLDEMLTGRRPDLTPQVQAILWARVFTERYPAGALRCPRDACCSCSW